MRTDRLLHALVGRKIHLDLNNLSKTTTIAWTGFFWGLSNLELLQKRANCGIDVEACLTYAAL